mgnify:CR=1 FL=1
MPKRWIDYMRLADLARAPRNPKDHDAELIQASLRRFGYVEAIAIDERTGRLVAGHGRLDELERGMAAGEDLPEGLEADETGHWLVPVQRGWASTDDAEAEAYVVTSNQGTIAGGWKPAELVDVLSDLAAGPGLDGVGFDNDALEDLRAGLQPEPAPARTDPDDAPPEPATPHSRPGDLWLCGPHRVLCGDSRDPAAIARVLDGADADAVWTDPPYGVDYVGTAGSFEGDDAAGLEDLLTTVLGNTHQATRPGACWYVAGPAGPNGLTFGKVLTDLGVWRQTIVWVKDRFVLGRGDYHYRHELLYAGDQPEDPQPMPSEDGEPPETVAYGWTAGAAHRPPPDRKQDTVWAVPRPMASKDHPTMKPVELIERALANSTTPGQLVLDPFGGSGSTLIAAHRLGRRAAIIELAPGYTDVICRRWAEHTGQPVIHAETGEPHPASLEWLSVDG